MAIRLTESRLHQIIREEVSKINEMGFTDPEGSIAEPRVAGLKYQSASAMNRAVDRLFDKLSKTKHPKSSSGYSYATILMSAVANPALQQKALKQFNDFANKAGFNHRDDDYVKSTVWKQLNQDYKAATPEDLESGGYNIPLKPGTIPWSKT